MDKSYETFQFIDSDNNQDINQLLVLQEDGTLLSVNRDIQYIAQVQDDKEEIEDPQNCAVFDVSSQQFFVNVENKSDLSVQEQFAIPNEDQNIYSDSFLIQEVGAKESPGQMETESDEIVTALKPDILSSNETNATSKPVNNFTEITLTDAQYHLLEQKGWILLEFGGSVFVLDTLGLHDITNNEKLIEKLKNELEQTSSQQNQQTETRENESESNQTENIKNNVLEIEFKARTVTEKQDIDDISAKSNSVNELCGQDTTDDRDEPTQSPNVDEPEDFAIIQRNDSQRKGDSIKIKTKYTFNDITEKIFLGRTVNGKKLFAKITKRKNSPNKIQKMREKNFEKNTTLNASNDAQFVSILQDYIRDHPSKTLVGNVIAADTVVNQLVQMPHIMNSVVGNYVVVTKTVIFASEDGTEKSRRRPTTVMGEINTFRGRFIHTPYMLHNILKPVSDEMNTARISLADKIKQDFIEFVHIEVTETNIPRKPSVQSINVCNRKISLDVLRDARKKHPNPIYACGACAAVFKTESALKEHSENNCLGAADPDDTLTIDTDQLQEQSDSYYMLDTGKDKWYSCMQCQAKFLKLSNFKKHVKSHMRPNRDSDTKTTEIKEYKCKMCPSKYFHSSSLSKHIVRMHLRNQVKKT